MRIRSPYAALAGLLLVVETGIALFVHDGPVRGYGGDSLAVIFLYCGLMATTRLSAMAGTMIALATAAAIEIAQGLHLLERAGLEHVGLARIVLGASFDPRDFLAYAIGAGLILVAEACRTAPKRLPDRPDPPLDGPDA